MPKQADHEALRARLRDNRARLEAQLGHLGDLTWRDLLLPEPGGRPTAALLVYQQGTVDNSRLEDRILRPLFEHGARLVTRAPAGKTRLPVATVQGAADLGSVVLGILRGHTALLIDGHPEALLLNVKDPPARPIEDTVVEPSVHGGRESFTSLIDVNLALMRQRLPTRDLCVERQEIGALTRTVVVITYLRGKAAPALVEQVRRQLGKLNPETVFDTENLITALSDRPNSLAPTVLITERPDLVVHHLASGRVAVLADNSNRVLILPAVFKDFLNAADDLYELRPFVLLVRSIRMLAFLLAVFLPSLYVAVTTFHLQALPTLITLSLLAQREGAPLPTPVEALVMTIIFEILREAGLRLPRPVGPSVSIVGGLVIGEAAMRAGITSPAMVLVVSATAISTFALPSTSLANVATILRLVLLVLSSMFGFFGLILGYVYILAHFAGLTSGRIPYATPIMPLHPGFLRDLFGQTPRPPYGPGPVEDPTMSLPPGRKDQE